MGIQSSNNAMCLSNDFMEQKQEDKRFWHGASCWQEELRALSCPNKDLQPLTREEHWKVGLNQDMHSAPRGDG